MTPEDRKRLEHMLTMAVKLQSAIERKQIDQKSLLEDEDIQWLVTTPLYAIGEDANNVSRSFADSHPQIPFAQVAGLRHRLVHSYEKINWNLISKIVLYELSDLIKVLDTALQEE